MNDLAVPIGIAVLAGFGLVYGWILHSAVERSVYKATGIRFLDSYFLSWILGQVGSFTPASFYLAFGFDEFGDTPDGVKLKRRLQQVARFQLLCLALYGLGVLALVPQK